MVNNALEAGRPHVTKLAEILTALNQRLAGVGSQTLIGEFRYDRQKRFSSIAGDQLIRSCE